jgi:hypothetical protein
MTAKPMRPKSPLGKVSSRLKGSGEADILRFSHGDARNGLGMGRKEYEVQVNRR